MYSGIAEAQEGRSKAGDLKLFRALEISGLEERREDVDFEWTGVELYSDFLGVEKEQGVSGWRSKNFPYFEAKKSVFMKEDLVPPLSLRNGLSN
jgi:hypothetical protein